MSGAEWRVWWGAGWGAGWVSDTKDVPTGDVGVIVFLNPSFLPNSGVFEPELNQTVSTKERFRIVVMTISKTSRHHPYSVMGSSSIVMTSQKTKHWL